VTQVLLLTLTTLKAKNISDPISADDLVDPCTTSYVAHVVKELLSNTSKALRSPVVGD
jgi:hypothetical protein